MRSKGAKRFLMLGFYNGKLTPNEPKISDFQNLPENRLKVIFTSSRNVGDKKWSPFFGFTCPKQGHKVREAGKGLFR